MLDEKEIEKTKKEILELHCRCIETALKKQGVSFYGRKKFFQLYNIFITPDVVLDYFFKPINIFINALVCGNQEDIRDFRTPKKKKKIIKRRKK